MLRRFFKNFFREENIGLNFPISLLVVGAAVWLAVDFVSWLMT